MRTVRPAAVAGSFYSGSSEALAREGDAVGDPPNQAELDGAPRRHPLGALV